MAVSVRKLTETELSELGVQNVFTGLGFEDRTLASNQFLSKLLKPLVVEATSYSLPGHATAILSAWRKSAIRVIERSYQGGFLNPLSYDGLSLVDVSGLAKPLIFEKVRKELMTKGRVLICHALAEKRYPLEEDLEALFARRASDDPISFLEKLDQVLRGEKGPYSLIGLLRDDSDPSRQRTLISFASPIAPQASGMPACPIQPPSLPPAPSRFSGFL